MADQAPYGPVASLPSGSMTLRRPHPDTPATETILQCLKRRFFPPMTKEQADILASLKFPCC